MAGRKLKITACLSIAALLWLIFIGTSIWQFGNEDNTQKSDCVIVLGAAIKGSEPSPVFAERINHSINLYKTDTSSSIIFTGGIGEGHTLSEAEVGVSYAIRNGVNSSNIFKETISKTTRENLIYAKEVMDKEGFKSAIIVSDPLHLMRASTMARDLGIKIFTSPTPTSRYRTVKTKFCFLLREIYFYHHYRVFGK